MPLSSVDQTDSSLQKTIDAEPEVDPSDSLLAPSRKTSTDDTQRQKRHFAESMQAAHDQGETFNCAEYTRNNNMTRSRIYSWSKSLRTDGPAFLVQRRKNYTLLERHHFASCVTAALNKGQTFDRRRYSQEHNIPERTVSNWFYVLKKDAAAFLNPSRPAPMVEKKQFLKSVKACHPTNEAFSCTQYAQDHGIPSSMVENWYGDALRQDKASKASLPSRQGPHRRYSQQQREDFVESVKAHHQRGEQFNCFQYARANEIPRSTVRDWHQALKKEMTEQVGSHTALKGGLPATDVQRNDDLRQDHDLLNDQDQQALLDYLNVNHGNDTIDEVYDDNFFNESFDASYFDRRYHEEDDDHDNGNWVEDLDSEQFRELLEDQWVED